MGSSVVVLVGVLMLGCAVQLRGIGAAQNIIIERPIIVRPNLTTNVDLKSHPGDLCNRKCVVGENKICYFTFVLENYHALGPACGGCVRGVEEDCNHPQCILGDGTAKGVMSINRRIPGPDIQVCQGDHIVVDVVNHAHGSAASIHWHGLHMRNTPWMDGVPYTTQCPIPYATTFRYSFFATESGTQFYHSHSGHHKVNGQYGALIVREPAGNNPNEGTYDFDLPEHHILISDWMHSYGENLFPGNSNGIGPDSVLINGRGIYTDPRTMQHTGVPFTKYFVQAGKRYRFRVINAVSNACPFQIQVEGHRMEIIASDSFNIEPTVFDTLVTNSGERFDFILTANRTAGDFWIRVRGLAGCANTPIESFALLHYGVGSEDLHRQLHEIPNYNDEYPHGLILNHPNAACFGGEDDHCVSELVAQETEDALRFAEPDHKFFLGFTNTLSSNSYLFKPGTYNHFISVAPGANLVGNINNISLVFPSYPPLTQPEDIDESAICNENNRPANCMPGQVCPCIHIIKIGLNTIVELVIVDQSPTFGRMHHPFHLHGYRFMVVGLGQHPLGVPMTVEIAKELERRRSLPRDYFNENPPFKDTVSIPSKGYAVVRFIANNPGFWLMHCHYEWHMAVGMGLILQVGETKDMVPPPANFPKCGNYLTPIPNTTQNK